MSSIPTPRQNHILAALPDVDYVRLLPHLEHISMPLEWKVYEADRPLGYLYFPTTCIISLFHVLESGASAEFAITGNEGMVGISLFMGGTSMPSEARVQSAGSGYRLKANILKKELALNSQLQYLGLRYIQMLITQVAQTAVCNRHHYLEQQLCRWFLLRLDRLPNNDLMITQERIANDLGVRRESVTEAAGKFQAEGLIQYQRGHISVLDRQKLESRVCECYMVQKREFERVLSYPKNRAATAEAGRPAGHFSYPSGTLPQRWLHRRLSGRPGFAPSLSGGASVSSTTHSHLPPDRARQ